MATTLNEERVAPLRAMVEDGLPSGPATPDTQKDQDELAAIARGTPTMVDLLFMPEAADVEFELSQSTPELATSRFLRRAGSHA